MSCALRRSRVAALAVLLPCALALGGCSPEPPLVGWNLVVIVLDSLRADHLGSYGHPTAQTPVLDSLAREGLVFERAVSNSSYTRESVASLFTGRLPSPAGATGWGARPARDADTLADLLVRRGYRTALFSNSIMLRDPHFHRGFEVTRYVGPGQMASQGGPRLVGRALDFVGRLEREAFFLYLHLLDPHGPYQPPAAVRDRFLPDPPADPVILYGELRDRSSELRATGFGPGDPRFEDLLARYDAEIAHQDESLRRLVEGLRAAGLLENSVLVVTADHGEEFLEHDFVEHAWTVYEESIHVPLILWAPGRIRSGRVADRVSLVDLLPTLVTLLGLEPPQQPLEGSALLEPTRRAWAYRRREGPTFSELQIQTRNQLRSVVDGDWKYIAATRWLEPSEREVAVRAKRVNQTPRGMTPTDSFGPTVREELYHLGRDPGETRNLAEEKPEQLQRMRDLLAARMAGARARGDVGLQTLPALSEEDREQLRALGYLDAEPTDEH